MRLFGAGINYFEQVGGRDALSLDQDPAWQVVHFMQGSVIIGSMKEFFPLIFQARQSLPSSISINPTFIEKLSCEKHCESSDHKDEQSIALPEEYLTTALCKQIHGPQTVEHRGMCAGWWVYHSGL